MKITDNITFVHLVLAKRTHIPGVGQAQDFDTKSVLHLLPCKYVTDFPATYVHQY